MNYGYGQPTGYGYSPMIGPQGQTPGGLKIPGVGPFQKADTSIGADERRLKIMEGLGMDEGMLHDFFKGRQAFNTWKGDMRGALGDTVLGNGTGGFAAANSKLASAFSGGRDPEAGVKLGKNVNIGGAQGMDEGTGEGGLSGGGKAALLKSL